MTPVNLLTGSMLRWELSDWSPGGSKKRRFMDVVRGDMKLAGVRGRCTAQGQMETVDPCGKQSNVD